MNNLTQNTTVSNATSLDTAGLEIMQDALSLWENGSFSQARAEIYSLLGPLFTDADYDISELAEAVGEEASDPYDWANFVNRSLFLKLRKEMSIPTPTP